MGTWNNILAWDRLGIQTIVRYVSFVIGSVIFFLLVCPCYFSFLSLFSSSIFHLFCFHLYILIAYAFLVDF